MSHNNLVVGKHTLESLTVGMYADNRIIFREYIQNATDAIDQAIKLGILREGEGEIDITIDLPHREIRIRDNGTGIPTEEVLHSLGDIGHSNKDHVTNRGFRGIGRLGGLGYCTELKFITSYQGEPYKTITLWDAQELRRLLQPNSDLYENVIEVVDAVTIIEKQEELTDAHYFEVVLTEITDGHENLLDTDDIRCYLSQVAPVPFNYQQGIVLQKINKHLCELGVRPEEYKLLLHAPNKMTEQIYKPYCRQVHAGKMENEMIQDICFFESFREDGALFLVGWYGKTELSGMVHDDSVNGLRIRKRNILIGDNHSLDTFFGNNRTYQNFNRWYVGEVYVFDDQLIPNARRDDFEKNKCYFKFKQAVEKTTHALAKIPHKQSAKRSSNKKRKEIPSKMQSISKEILNSGVTETRKGQLIVQVDSLRKQARMIRPAAYSIPAYVSVEQSQIDQSKQHNEALVIEVEGEKQEILAELDALEEAIVSTNNFAANRLPTTLPKTCRKQIRIIFDVIDRVAPEGLAQELREEIITALQPKRKTERNA